MNFFRDSGPIILDPESDQSTLHLVFSDSEDEFGRRKNRTKSKSWHNQVKAHTEIISNNCSWNHSCNCKAEDFQQVRRSESKSSSKSVTMTRSEINPREFNKKFNLRNKLEIMLSEAVSGELELLDKNRPLLLKLNNLDTLLENLVQYLDCLDLEMRASVRLCTNIAEFLSPEIQNQSFSNLLQTLCAPNKLNYYHTKKTITSTLVNTKDLDNQILDYKDKRMDFNKAIENFRMVLDSNFSESQMKKLRKQFDLILVKYQHSRHVLDKTLPRVINTRMSVLLNCFEKLGEDLQKIANERSDLSLLFQHLESSFSQTNCINILPTN